MERHLVGRHRVPTAFLQGLQDSGAGWPDMPWWLVHVSQSRRQVGESTLLPNTQGSVPWAFTSTEDRSNGGGPIWWQETFPLVQGFLKSQSFQLCFGHIDTLPVLLCMYYFYFY